MVSQQIDRTPTGEEIAFLHRLDSVERETIVVATDRSRLAGASFLDGRETFWRDQAFRPLDLTRRSARKATRFVFHVGFAGSTLLARLLDRPGHVVALKEPQCLADIAGQRELIAAGRAAAPLGPLLDYALAELGSVRDDDVTVVVKPTNWVNSLLPELCAPGRVTRAVFVSMKRRHFLGATFRGGNQRLAFCARLAAQIAPVVPDGDALLRSAVAGGGDTLDQMARLMALLHWFQESLFDAAIARNGWPVDTRIDFEKIVADPEAAVRRARECLDLPPLPGAPERAAILMKRHTKDPSSAFRPAKRAREDQAVEEHHGARFDAALDWLEANVR
ncbi:hypothetical protein [Pelagerythrobacter sp.]|uniref:hypothetical protein n=1 Tax=Pelagerythrobacter sp. TaxID=2800702 RepID=UPI0035AF66E6